MADWSTDLSVGTASVSLKPFHGREPPSLRRRADRVIRHRGPGLAIFVLYVALAVLYEGRDAIFHLGAGTIGKGPDIQIYIWGLRWWPFALAHGLDPLVSHVVWPPYGADVLWTTTVPALSLLAAPLTAAFGLTAAYNVLCLLAPASSAWAAYALCRELTAKRWPSVVGGALYGFSSFQMGEARSHLHLTATMLVPLAALVIVRFVRGRLSGRGLALSMCAIGVVQFFIAPEVLATMVVMGAIGALAALALLRDARRRVSMALLWSAAGLAGAAVLLTLPLVTMLGAGAPQLNNAPVDYSADLLNFVVPTPVTAIGGARAASIAAHFPGNLDEQGAYLGVPLLIMVAVYAVVRRRARGTWLLLAVFLAAIVLSLGPQLHVDGRILAWLPGSLAFALPLLKSAIPARFALYTALVAGVIVATMLATAPREASGVRRWAWAGVCLATLAPAGTAKLWWQPTPPAIAHQSLARALPRGSTVISVPFGDYTDRTLYAQAASNMRFNVIDGWMQIAPPQARASARWWVLGRTRVRPNDVTTLKRDLCRIHVTYAVAWWPHRGRDGFFSALHLKARDVGHVWVYRLPGCSAPPPGREPGTRFSHREGGAGA